MRKTRKILSILLSCLMLMSLLSVGVFAAEGDQDNPINANDKWFGYGVDCYLLNTTLEAGDADGVWYELTADADHNGILQLEHNYKNEEDGSHLEYQLNAWVNGIQYVGYEDGIYYRPITTYPLAAGNVVTIQIIAQDTTLGGTVYLSAKFIDGSNDINQMVKVKAAPAKLRVAAGATVYFQDDSLNADYATKYVTLTGTSVSDVTLYTAAANASGTVIKQKPYADTDGDDIIEAQLGGSEGTAGTPAVKPAWAIENNSGEDREFILAVVDEAHECVYDDNNDADCNICGAPRGNGCSHAMLDTQYLSSDVSGQHTIVYTCQKCGETVNTEDGQCFGGSATCVDPATCNGCKMPYGAADGAHIFGDDDSIICINCGEEIPTVVVSTAKEANAGDEIQVTVNLEGLDSTAGLIAALVEIGFDPNVFELVTYYDEDEEMWLPAIEVGNKYNASSNKYITFSQINEDTGFSAKCVVLYKRATATASQVRKESHFFTATFKVKDDAYSGTYELFADDPSFVAHGNVVVTMAIKNTSITINGTEPPHVCTFVGAVTKEPNCINAGVMTYTCECGESYEEAIPANGVHEFFNDCDATCINCYEEVREASHNVIHVEAKEATCAEMGNIEYWYCDICGSAWLDEACTKNTSVMAVKLPMAEHEYMYACDGWCVNCYEFTNPDAAHNLTHVEAKAATCTENGNIEYYTCEYCGGCWDNENAMGMPLNKMMTILWAGHTYTDDMDTDCDVCGDIRVVEYEVLTFGGNAISPEVDGLAFQFKLQNMAGLAIVNGTNYKADFSNTYVTPDSTGTYKLVSMGAVVSNNWGITRLEYVDNEYTVNVVTDKLQGVKDSKPYYTVRVINIPDAKKDTYITITPYCIYKNAEGESITIYGDEQMATYNGALAEQN